MLTVYAQASNTIITSQTYQKWSGDVILSNRGRYSSVYKLQEKIEYGLLKASLISSVSYFNLWVKALCGKLSGDGTGFRAPCDSVWPPLGGMESRWYGSGYRQGEHTPPMEWERQYISCGSNVLTVTSCVRSCLLHPMYCLPIVQVRAI